MSDLPTRSLVLPPNASPLELALARALALPDDFIELPSRLEERFDWPADAELPFLIWEWGLQPVTKYLSDPRQALREGRPWQRRRGTLAAGHIARGWIGIVADVEVELAKRLHIHLRDLIDGELLDAVIDLSRLSSSVRTQLFRLTHQFDIRPLIGGRSRNGDALYSAFSGIKRHPDEPKLSFRAKRVLGGSLGVPKAAIAPGLGITLSGKRFYPIQYGRSRLPAKSAQPYRFSASLSIPLANRPTDNDHRVSARVTPRFAVVGGRSKLGRAIYFGARLRPGRPPRTPFLPHSNDSVRPFYEALAAPPARHWMVVSGVGTASGNADVAILVSAFAKRPDTTSELSLSLGLSGAARLGADAPFSSHSFLDADWGAGLPRAVSDITQEPT